MYCSEFKCVSNKKPSTPVPPIPMTQVQPNQVRENRGNRPFSKLFYVAASRPAKSPQGSKPLFDGPSKYKNGERVKSFSQKVCFQLVTSTSFSDYGANLVLEVLTPVCQLQLLFWCLERNLCILSGYLKQKLAVTVPVASGQSKGSTKVWASEIVIWMPRRLLVGN
jgi:hypothetical protein